MALPSLMLESFRTYLLAVKQPATANKYAHGAERFMAFVARNSLTLGTLPPGILSLFSESLVHEGLRPASVAVYVAAARRFLEWLRAKGEVNVPHLARIDLPRIETPAPNALTQDALLAFLRGASHQPEPARTALLLMPFCGLRVDELARLSLESIAKVDVPPRAGSPPTTYICFTVRGKGGKVRTVPLLLDGTPLLIAYLRMWRRRVPGKWLFPSPTGEGAISARTLRWRVKKLHRVMITQGFTTQKVRRLTSHTLRRTYLNTLHRAGLDIPTLTRIAGHESVQTTMKHYLEIRPEDMTSAVHRTGARLVPTGAYAQTVEQTGSKVHELLERLREGKTT